VVKDPFVEGKCLLITTATSRCLIAVVWSPPLLRVVGRNDKATFPEGSDHLIAPNRLEFFGSESGVEAKQPDIIILEVHKS